MRLCTIQENYVYLVQETNTHSVQHGYFTFTHVAGLYYINYAYGQVQFVTI